MKQEVVWLAGLLHDIGKFRQRAVWEQGRQSHEVLGAEWASQDYFAQIFGSDLEVAIRLHHTRDLPSDNADRRRLCQIVQIADRLAAAERTTSPIAQQEPHTSRLVSVFSRIPRDWSKGGSTDFPSEKQFPLQPLDWENHDWLPTDPLAPGDYPSLWHDFEEEWNRFTAQRTFQTEDFRTIVAILEKYLSFVPSATPWEPSDERTVPDISLFDHLRVTSAISACLDKQLTHDDTERVYRDLNACQEPIALLVKGDLSGIQAFLYLMTSRGVARGLKGRSFYLQLLTEAVSEFLLDKLRLPIVCRLFASGGHFYLLVPYNQHAELIALHAQVSERLLDAHGGDLRLIMGAVPLTCEDFLKRFANKWTECAQVVGRKKLQMGSELPDERFAQLFQPQQRATDATTLCQVCQGVWRSGEGNIVEEGVRKCRRCVGFEDLGRDLRESSCLIIEKSEPRTSLPSSPTWSEVLESFGWKVHLIQLGQPEPFNLPSVVRIAFSPQGFLPSRIQKGWSYEFRPFASATPALIRGEDRIPDFEEIAERSKGAPWLGVLRMDVDSLGALFAKGLGQDATISRMATLSRTMRLFFEGYVAFLCQPYAKAQQLYLIYAGGDDLFIVGAWSILPEIAHTIRQRFHQLVGDDHITVSAGIAIGHGTTPLYQLAEQARIALDEQAKEHQWKQNGQTRTKDSISFLRTPMGWGEFEQVRQLFEQVCALVEGSSGDKVPRALIERLAGIAYLYQRNRAHVRRVISTGQVPPNRERDLTLYAKWMWRSVYHLARFAERHKNQKQALETIRNLLSDPNQPLVPFAGVVARWAELYTRKSS